MPEGFRLRVLSPEGTACDQVVSAVTLPSLQGEITVLPEHMPVVVALTDGEIRAVTAEGEISLAVEGGFARVEKQGVTVLSDFAAGTEGIEPARAQEAKRRAEELLKESREKKDIALAERDLHRAILQLNVAEKLRRRRPRRP